MLNKIPNIDINNKAWSFHLTKLFAYIMLISVFLFTSTKTNAQTQPDKIQKTDGTIIESRILRVDEANNRIIFKHFNDQRGPNDTISTFEVSIIVYRNGDFKTFNIDRKAKRKHKTEGGWDFKVKKEEAVEYKIKGAANVRIGSGLLKVDNYNYARSLTKVFDKKIGDSPPLLLGIDFGVSFKFMVGGLLQYDKQKFELQYADTIVELGSSTVYFALQGTYYPKVKSEKFKYYTVVGMNYIFRTDENTYYYLMGKEKRWGRTNIESDVYVGWLARIGVDYMFVQSLGVSANVGWGPTIINVSLILKP